MTDAPEVSIEGLGPVVTADEAAQLLSVKRQRVHQLLAEGKLSGRTLGATMFVSRRSITLYKQTPRKRGWPKGKPRQVVTDSKKKETE